LWAQETGFRVEQSAAVERADPALRAADKGVGLVSAEEFRNEMKQRALTAQQRIRAEVAAKDKQRAK